MTGCCQTQEAREPEPAPPPYELLRQDEDYSYLRDPRRQTDFFDPVKFIPLDAEGTIYLTLGGEGRARYEYFRNGGWGTGLDRDASLLQRYMMHADLHAGTDFRVFAQLKSGLEHGRDGGPRGPDEDRLDLHQGFADGVLRLSEEDFVMLRLGRQELQYGSSRLVSPREGPNVRQSFDAVRAISRIAKWRLEAFVSRPVETDRGIFDDGSDKDRWFWGVYAVSPEGWLRGTTADIYYLGIDREEAEFDQGIEREVRHSVGTRLFGTAGSLDYNVELVYQSGRFGDGAVRAWTVASDTGYTSADLPLRPRISLKADAASGDRDASNSDLQTFNPLFPKGSYFSETGLIGPSNFYDLHPAVRVQLAQDVDFTLDWCFFWRFSDEDGVYGPSVNLVRTGQVTRERYVGSQLSGFIEWQIQRHVSLVLFYAHFFAGPFLEETPPGEDVDFFGSWLTFKF
jgi:hypothetical protein